MYTEDRVKLAEYVRDMDAVCGSAGRNLEKARTAAYKVAVVVNRILSASMNELVEEIRLTHKGRPVAAWMIDQFKSYVALGGDYAAVLRAVDSGVTLERFLAMDFTIIRKGLAKPKPKQKPAPIAREIPAPPLDTAPIEEKAAVYEERSEFLDLRVGDLAEQLEAAKLRIRELENENLILKRQIRELKK